MYELDSIKLDKKTFKNRLRTVWRYHELLPISESTNIVDLGAGYTILHKCDRLAEVLGLKKLYIKDDTVNPTNSFKDRPATVAVSKALEFRAQTVGCASTGNLAAATAAHVAKAGLPCYVFIPADTELNKILQAATYGAKIVAVKGTYDQANRLAYEVSEAYDWTFVNINLRPYYVEGSKTLAFEICEQLGWRAPDNIIIPVASGALLCAIQRGLSQFKELNLINNEEIRLIGAQPDGCSPIVDAFKSNSDYIKPIENPISVSRSLNIGDPGDGFYALKAIRESRGVAASASDEETLEAIELLAKKEGIFAEPAGGITIAILKKLVELGEISADEETVCCVTGSGFKEAAAILQNIARPIEIEPTLDAVSKIIGLQERKQWEQ